MLCIAQSVCHCIAGELNRHRCSTWLPSLFVGLRAWVSLWCMRWQGKCEQASHHLSPKRSLIWLEGTDELFVYERVPPWGLHVLEKVHNIENTSLKHIRP